MAKKIQSRFSANQKVGMGLQTNVNLRQKAKNLSILKVAHFKDKF